MCNRDWTEQLMWIAYRWMLSIALLFYLCLKLSRFMLGVAVWVVAIGALILTLRQ